MRKLKAFKSLRTLMILMFTGLWRRSDEIRSNPIELGLDPAPVANGKPLQREGHKCKTCGTTESDTWYGEKVNGNLLIPDKWIHWCGRCYKLKFCADMRSAPQALAKYYQIYGKSPEEQLKINE